MGVLDEILAKIQSLPEGERENLIVQMASLPVWAPNPGPQTTAFNCAADELFYGGQAGGGKTDLTLGSALTQHTKSLLLRRYNKDAKGMADRLLDEILQSRDSWNGQDLIWRGGGNKTIEFGGCQEERDKQRYKGKPHDLIAFDEITDFLESQYRFICAWNRTTVPGQRCRIIATGNPPTEASGLWVIQYWGPWLDPTHPSPAREGELRWYTTIKGRDVEVDGHGPHYLEGETKPVYARSRTFIRARLEDNPDLMADGQYDAVLAALPDGYRAAYRDGKFDASMKDDPWQMIPTAWVREAQARWTPNPPLGVPMCAIGVDVAQGGADNNVLAIRHDGWYAPMIVIPGSATPLGGPNIAGIVVSKRRDSCTVVIDCGGGYGGPVYEHLKENGIEVLAYKGAEGSVRRTEDKKLGFYNKRAEAYWRFREALDPNQPQGSTIMLPSDPILLSDLVAPTYEGGAHGIKMESKEDLTVRLGRSPDRGDAVVMAWIAGDKISSSYHLWRQHKTPQVINSHMSARRR